MDQNNAKDVPLIDELPTLESMLRRENEILRDRLCKSLSVMKKADEDCATCKLFGDCSLRLEIEVIEKLLR